MRESGSEEVEVEVLPSAGRDDDGSVSAAGFVVVVVVVIVVVFMDRRSIFLRRWMGMGEPVSVNKHVSE